MSDTFLDVVERKSFVYTQDHAVFSIVNGETIDIPCANKHSAWLNKYVTEMSKRMKEAWERGFERGWKREEEKSKKRIHDDNLVFSCCRIPRHPK